MAVAVLPHTPVLAHEQCRGEGLVLVGRGYQHVVSLGPHVEEVLRQGKLKI